MNLKSKSWIVAQEHERQYWNDRRLSCVGFLHDLSGNGPLALLIEKTILESDFKKVLEIGVGGLGIGLLWLFPNAEIRIGVDPILPSISKCGNPFVESLVSMAQSGVQYFEATGEKMPFTNGYFDLVICNNVLDHVDEPIEILMEINRVLKPGGIIAFGVDISSIIGGTFRRLNRRLNPKNIAYLLHPHDFTFYGMSKLLRSCGFTTVASAGTTWKGAIAGRPRRSVWILSKSSSISTHY